jgi:cell division protein FtsN
MSRDYKNTKRRSSGGTSWSGVAGFVVGLALGLAVAMGVYLYDHRAKARVAQNEPIARDERSEPVKPSTPSQEPETQFDFYEMLPKFEVVVPEEDGKVVAPSGASPAVEKPGAYILQAGSFRNHADADRVRALIAMQGVESKIQKVTIDKDTWHRVRVGPIANLQKLEETRSRLRQAQIDALVIRVGE